MKQEDRKDKKEHTDIYGGDPRLIYGQAKGSYQYSNNDTYIAYDKYENKKRG